MGVEWVGVWCVMYWVVLDILVVGYVLFLVLWIFSLLFKLMLMVKDGKLILLMVIFDNYCGIFWGDLFSLVLINFIGIGLIIIVIVVVFGVMVVYVVVWLEFLGKWLLIGVVLLIMMFLLIFLVILLFNIECVIGLFDIWLGLILLYIIFVLLFVIYILLVFFWEIFWDLEKVVKMDGVMFG